jgi:hypothetical protein
MGVKTFARNDVLDAIAVNVCACHGVGLGETNAVGVTLWFFAWVDG